MNDSNVRSADTNLDQRISRATAYLVDHMGDQQDWYDRKATRNKTYSWALSIALIVCGGLVGFLQTLGTGDVVEWLTVWGIEIRSIGLATAILGLVIVVIRGLERVCNFDETWLAYRKASEMIKRERRLYITGVGAYAKLEDEETAFRHFVWNVEEIVSYEQNLFWRAHMDETPDTDK